jgi:RNA recognition motif-containing protein
MSKNIYVGNLSLGTTQEEIRKLFEQYGEIDSVDLVTIGIPVNRSALRSFICLTKEPEGLSWSSIANIKVNEAKRRQTISFERRRPQPPPIGMNSKQA